MFRIKKPVAAILSALILATTLSSCYGNFSLVRLLYKFNGSIGDRNTKVGGVINSIILYVLFFVQIYTLTFVVDAVVLNLIEFWTGSNPVAINNAKGDSSVAMTEEGIFNERLRIEIKGENGKGTFFAFKDKPGILYIQSNGKYTPVNTSVTEENGQTTISLKSEGFYKSRTVNSIQFAAKKLALESRFNTKVDSNMAAVTSNTTVF